MKLLNKIFGLSLLPISASPTLACLNNTNVDKTIVLNSNTNELEEKDLRCTVAYVGKNITKDGLAIIARTNDSSPMASHSYLKKVKHNEIAGTTIKNEFGFEYTFPNETYAYISSPDGPKTMEEHDRHLWENMGINEMGVGITCTLTCTANSVALANDPHNKAGLAEEAFNQILASQASSARRAMEIAAETIDKYGSEDANLILATDQNETWLMELYTGHQYCAVKLPDDVMFVAGNEFILDSLSDLGVSEANKENCIVSKDLLNYPVENGFAKYKDGGTDIYHLDLFNTYADEGTTNPDHEGSNEFAPSCHMRTWRGYSLFEPKGETAQLYSDYKKYAPFFKPTDSEGNLRTDMSIYDIIQIYRDEFDELIGQDKFKEFTDLKASGKLRPIATESARLVHIITSNPNLPKEIACNALYCPSSANYVPFVLLNNGIDSFEGEYAYYPNRWQYEDDSASVLFRHLNSIAWPHREKYGYPLQDFWRANEYIYITQMQQVIEDASKLSSMSDTKNIITNFNNHLRDVYIETVKYVTEDLIWHDMNQDHRAESKIKEFVPYVDIQQYLSALGWTDFKKSDDTLTFKYENNVGKLEIPAGFPYQTGKLYINNNEFDINVKYKNDKVYVGFAKLNEAIGDKASIIKINVKDYLSKSFNHLVWIIPTIVVVVIAAGVVTFLLIRRNKKNKSLQNK